MNSERNDPGELSWRITRIIVAAVIAGEENGAFAINVGQILLHIAMKYSCEVLRRITQSSVIQFDNNSSTTGVEKNSRNTFVTME